MYRITDAEVVAITTVDQTKRCFVKHDDANLRIRRTTIIRNRDGVVRIAEMDWVTLYRAILQEEESARKGRLDGPRIWLTSL